MAVRNRRGGAAADAHFLDGFESDLPDEELDGEKLMTYWSTTAMLMNRDPLDAVLVLGAEATAAFEHFSFLFGDFPDTEVKSAVENAFNAALVTKFEQEFFGTYYDNKDKTARCKRLIVQIQDVTPDHIWNNLHKVVHALVELATQPKIKKGKGRLNLQYREPIHVRFLSPYIYIYIYIYIIIIYIL